MKQAIYYSTKKNLFGSPDRQLSLFTGAKHYLLFAKITFSSKFLSTPSPVMQMCCCSI